MHPLTPRRARTSTRALLGVLAVLAVCAGAGCTDSIELVPDAAARDGARADGTAADATADGLAADGPAADSVAADQGVDSAPSCVCRFVQCRSNAECLGTIGPASTCDNPGTLSCSGSVGSCRLDGDCGGAAAGWRCTDGPTSLSACP